MKWNDHIHVDTSVLCGKPVIKGTRLSVEFLLGLLGEGWSTTQLLENYPQLKSADLQAVFLFSSECIKDEEVLSCSNLVIT